MSTTKTTEGGESTGSERGQRRSRPRGEKTVHTLCRRMFDLTFDTSLRFDEMRLKLKGAKRDGTAEDEDEEDDDDEFDEP
jgi:hypothetical protein